MKCGIYKIESPSNKIYVGSSVNIEQRFRKYKSLNCKSQTRLYNSFIKHGVENHKFSIITECKREDLYQYENLYSNYYDVLGFNGLNCVIVGYDGVNQKRSLETIEKHRLKIIGKKQTIEHGNKKRIAMLGKKHKASSIEKMRNKQISETTREKLRAKNKKQILNLESGIFYESLNEASFAHNICKGNLSSMINGSRIKKVNLVYI
jgi:group I intron endonuclease